MDNEKTIRLWPGVTLVSLQWFLRFVLPLLAAEAMAVSVFGGMLGGVLVLLWWAFFSRATRLERWGGSLLLVAVLLGTRLAAHPSISTGMMGMMFLVYAIPTVSLALVVYAALRDRLEGGMRWAAMTALLVLGSACWLLFRSDGIRGGGSADFAWRWAATPEELLLAEMGTGSHSEVPLEQVIVEAEWPGFRGRARDGVVHGSKIATDWEMNPPISMWRRAVGPGWSSFSVSGDVFFTQEQRGEEEVVSCYKLETGEPVWIHADQVRFWEANAGAGPRGTPTIHNGRIYAFGATGLLNALNAADGSKRWSRDVAADTAVEVPGWGFSSSPFVVADVVIVAAAGTPAAYDLETGEIRWTGPTGGSGYSSPHLIEIDGVPQVLMLNDHGMVSLTPQDGTVIWQHEWEGFRIVQPALIGEGEILVDGSEDTGIRRINVAHQAEAWTINEQWTSRGIKPYFNDLVVHKGHAYGFDGRILACVDLNDGARKWKGGRYGNGQMIVLADQDLLLVLSEKGEIALAEAKPDGFKELGRVPAIEGKTWNHPVLVGDVLLVRNDAEMEAFRLAATSN